MGEANTRLLTCVIAVVAVALVLGAAGAAEASGRPATDDKEGEAAVLQPRPGRTWYFGLRTGYYSGTNEPFIGGEVFVPLSDRLTLNPNVEWVFVQEIDGLATFNTDLVYDFPLSGNNFYWLGAGVGVRRFAKGGGWPPENNLALNLLAGVGFGQGQEFMPFLQGKVAMSDATEVVLTAGFRF